MAYSTDPYQTAVLPPVRNTTRTTSITGPQNYPQRAQSAPIRPSTPGLPPIQPQGYQPSMGINTENNANAAIQSHANQGFNAWYSDPSNAQVIAGIAPVPQGKLSVTTADGVKHVDTTPPTASELAGQQRAAARSHYMMNVLPNDPQHQALQAQATLATQAHMHMRSTQDEQRDQASADYATNSARTAGTPPVSPKDQSIIDRNAAATNLTNTRAGVLGATTRPAAPPPLPPGSDESLQPEAPPLSPVAQVAADKHAIADTNVAKNKSVSELNTKRLESVDASAAAARALALKRAQPATTKPAPDKTNTANDPFVRALGDYRKRQSSGESPKTLGPPPERSKPETWGPFAPASTQPAANPDGSLNVTPATATRPTGSPGSGGHGTATPNNRPAPAARAADLKPQADGSFIHPQYPGVRYKDMGQYYQVIT